MVVVYREQYGGDNSFRALVRTSNSDDVPSVEPENTSEAQHHQSTILTWITLFFTQLFLPQGYPDTVREDYIKYQVWDTIQAFCSTVCGILSMHVFLKSVGVGDAQATALSATLTWVLKDGIGMLGRITFAWWKGHALDNESKKWRFMADILNDISMFLELLLLPIFSRHTTIIMCVTSTMKGIVGVAGGATRTAITQYHAIRSNTADIAAKDGSQETCVNLVASTMTMFILPYVEENKLFAWLLFTTATFIHLMANYKAVRTLNYPTFNEERLNLYLDKFFHCLHPRTPQDINSKESVIAGSSFSDKAFCGYQIKLGYSLQMLIQKKMVKNSELNIVIKRFRNRDYLLFPHESSKTMYILLSSKATNHTVFEAYVYSTLVAIYTNYSDLYNRETLFSSQNKGDVQSLPKLMNILLNVDAIYRRRYSDDQGVSVVPLNVMLTLDGLIEGIYNHFRDDTRSKGWTLDSHNLQVDEWRGDWTRIQ